MSAESVRDVLAPRDECIDVMAEGVFASEVLGLREDLVDERPVREIVGVALDALAAHPVELLALLAEPKVCEMCGGHGEAQWLASCSECGGLGLDPLRNDRACSRCGGSCEVLVIRDDVPCPSCHGSGSVAVDVLDLLAEAGLLRRVGSGRAPDAGDAKSDEWELLPIVGPSERGWELIYAARGEQ